MDASDPSLSAPGTCFKFIVSSAEEAAALIRERLGDEAKVLSVRTVEAEGFSRLWARPRLEVIAQIPPSSEAPAAPEPDEDEDLEEEEKTMTAFETAAAPEAPEPRVSTAPRPRMAVEKRDLAAVLRRAGMSEIAIGRLQAADFWRECAELPLHRGLVDIAGHIRLQAERQWSGASLRRAAFLGTPGSGRTTALCKWLGQEIFRRARTGHVVTAEFDRPNPPGALPVFCEALGVPVARFPASTEPAVPGGFAYLDLPGLSLKDPSANTPIARFLDEEGITERVFVLNAAYDHAALRASYALARDLRATHVVFTHLDEVTQWGRLWDYLLDGALEPLFAGTGPSLTGDCEDDIFGALVRRTLAPANEPNSGVGDPGHRSVHTARSVYAATS